MRNLGIVISADYFPLKQIIDIIPLVEKQGYNQISVPEMWGHDIVTQLTIIALKTKKIHFSSGIINMFSRSPGLVAMTSATLQELSEGRFILGLGLSGPKVVENLHGKNFDKPLKRTKEFVQIVKTLLNNERLHFPDSTYGKLIDFKLSFKNKYSTKIHIAALGPKNMKLAAKIADGWIPVLMPLEAFRQQVDTMHKHLKNYGKQKDDFDITPFVLALKGDNKKTITLLKNHLAYYFGGMGNFYNNMLSRMGYEEIANEIRILWAKGNRKEAAEAIPLELLEDTCIMGTQKKMKEKLQDYYEAGATTPLVSLPFGTNIDKAIETIKILSPKQ